MARTRLDDELVSRGFFKDRDTAARAVMAGLVSTSNRRLDKPGQSVKAGIELHVRGISPYVSRGGIKLERGLDALGVDPAGLVCLDIGCSTGGFTDCLLSRGAAHVCAVDVGYAQFDWGLRGDSRVELLERTNIRDLAIPERAASFDLAVCDISFTSVTTIADTVRYLLVDGGAFLTLVKPQFEASRSQVGEGGVVRSREVWLEVLKRVEEALLSAGLSPAGLCPSPIKGAKGNREFLMLGIAGKDTLGRLDLEAALRGESVLLAR